MGERAIGRCTTFTVTAAETSLSDSTPDPDINPSTRRLHCRPALVTLTILLSLWLSGCTIGAGNSRLGQGDNSLSCESWLKRLDRLVNRYQAGDLEYHRIDGERLLRVDRMLASRAGHVSNLQELTEWLARANRYAIDGYLVEIANLSAIAPPGESLDRQAMENRLHKCNHSSLRIAHAVADDHSLPDRWQEVPDAYNQLKRLVGIYPLTSQLVLAGYRNWQQQMLNRYRQPLATIPLEGELIRWSGEHTSSDIHLASIERDRLGYPVIPADIERQLFALHAPVWEIDTAGDHDLPGTPIWQEGALPVVDTEQPTEYRRLSYAYLSGRIVPQLIYWIWFSERRPTTPVDLYAGAFDGLIYRVTLNERWQPLLRESIHPCGCYHSLHPAAALRLRPVALSDGEGVFQPQSLASSNPGKRVVLRITSNDHQLIRLYWDHQNRVTRNLTTRPYHNLRTLSSMGNSRSIFSHDGLIEGSERLERWLLWPMGVASPGAMRQWGQHATMLVGRRHFDDPDLIDRIYEYQDRPNRQGKH